MKNNCFVKGIAAVVAAAVITLGAGCAQKEAPVSGETTEQSVSVEAENTAGETLPESTQAEPQDTAPESSQTAPQETTPPSESGTPEEVPEQPTAGFSAGWSKSNSWESDGMTFSQFDVKLTNNSSAVSGWTAVIRFSADVELDQIWNASAQANGSALSVTNAEYNGELAAGASAEFGVIVKSRIAAEITELSVNGCASAVTPVQTTAQTTASSAQNIPAEIDPEKTGKYGLVSECGALSVNGADLVDKNGELVQLRGISTHGIQWFPQFVNKSAFKSLRDDWNVNVIRLAMYSGESEGYTASTREGIERTVQQAVDACIELDMYVIVDWHVLADQSPMVRKDDAVRFFDYMSQKYAKYPNVIYEICNEPNGYASWGGDIKPYAEQVIPVIRKNAPNAVVIVGTPTWSQDIDKALSDPLSFDNVMYALHFYAATHTDWLRDRLRNCYNSGLPVFVSEFGLCDASGGGANDFNQSKAWLELMDSLNVSYCAWALADKNETCCLLKPGAGTNGGWSDSELNESGKYIKEWLSKHE